MTVEKGQRVSWREKSDLFASFGKRMPIPVSHNFTSVNPYPESVSGGVTNISSSTSSSSSDVSD